MALKAHCGVLEGDHLLPWVGVSAPWCTHTSIKLIQASIHYWDTPQGLFARSYSSRLFHFIPLFIFDNLIDPPAD